LAVDSSAAVVVAGANSFVVAAVEANSSVAVADTAGSTASGNFAAAVVVAEADTSACIGYCSGIVDTVAYTPSCTWAAATSTVG